MSKADFMAIFYPVDLHQSAYLVSKLAGSFVKIIGRKGNFSLDIINFIN